MQVVICADVHLDGKTTVTKQEERNCFLGVIKQVQETGASLLLIAGDLVEADRVTEDTVQFLMQAFQMIPDTYIFIAPGNNDPATHNSIYVKEEWPENVFIFTGNLEAVELALPESGEQVRIYGSNYRSPSGIAQILSPENFPELDPSYINVLLLHGVPEPETLDRCGFDFCALGHVHNFSGVVTLGQTAYAYPGPCQGRGFGQTGGILVGSLVKGGQHLTLADIATCHYREVTLDVSPFETQEAILENIFSHFTQTKDHYRLTLTGKLQHSGQFSLTKLREALANRYTHIEVRGRFSRNTQEARPFVSGEFSDYVLKEAQSREGLEDTDPELLRLATEYALCVCPENETTPEEILTREEFPAYED